jgi:toxin ParE1/3/4
VKVRWTEPAVSQLQHIFEYIAFDNVRAADRTVRKIRDAIHRTARLPYTGRPGRIPRTREICVPGTSYLVGYKIVEKSLHVLAIFHGAQQWPESLEPRNP